MQVDRLQHKEVGQGPFVLEKGPARLPLVFSCLCEAMVRADKGTLVQETELHDGRNTIVMTM
jgi:hypothetical protein